MESINIEFLYNRLRADDNTEADQALLFAVGQLVSGGKATVGYTGQRVELRALAHFLTTEYQPESSALKHFDPAPWWDGRFFYSAIEDTRPILEATADFELADNILFAARPVIQTRELDWSGGCAEYLQAELYFPDRQNGVVLSYQDEIPNVEQVVSSSHVPAHCDYTLAALAYTTCARLAAHDIDLLGVCPAVSH